MFFYQKKTKATLSQSLFMPETSSNGIYEEEAVNESFHLGGQYSIFSFVR